MKAPQTARILLLLCVLIGAFPGIAAAGRDPGLDDSPLVQQLDALVHSDALKSAFVGVRIESLKDGRLIYSHESDRLYMPASNMKIVTSSSTLDALGPDFRMKTDLLANGATSADGKLAGDLILRGHGDSALETKDLADFVAALKQQGIKKITGNLLVDDTYFDDQRLGWSWSWDGESYYYSAQISALILNRNTIAVTVKPGKQAGLPAVVTLDPPTGYLAIQNTAVTGPAGSKPTIDITRLRGKNVVVVSGAISLANKPVVDAVTMEDPALYAGDILLGQLKQQGIAVLGQVKHARTPSSARVLYSHDSPPLSKILALLNKPSDNLIAECMQKTLAAEKKGRGTQAKGEEAELEFIKKIGGNPDQINIMDGSGLSRMDMISPSNFVAILRYMYNSPNAKVFIDSLPIAGVDGSLRSRMKGTPAENNVKAKTGYIGRVSTLSGYVTTKGGEPLVFSIMMNHYICPTATARGIQDQICQILAGQQ